MVATDNARAAADYVTERRAGLTFRVYIIRYPKTLKETTQLG